MFDFSDNGFTPGTMDLELGRKGAVPSAPGFRWGYATFVLGHPKAPLQRKEWMIHCRFQDNQSF